MVPHTIDGHLTDDDLLLAMALEEDPDTGLLEAHRHLRQCPNCRARRVEIETTLREGGEALLGGAPGLDDDVALTSQRARLVGALNAVENHPPRLARAYRPWLRSPIAVLPAWSVAAVAMIVIGLVVPWGRGNANNARDGKGVSAPRLLPAVSLTPGAASVLSVGDLCAGRRPSRVVAEEVRIAVLRSYAMEDVPADDYELDALITPELGGTTDARNLWPQRYASPVWHAGVKDVLERALAEDVCAGRTDLALAQREIATDWIAAYQRRFHTSAPLNPIARSKTTPRSWSSPPRASRTSAPTRRRWWSCR